ncbi:putative NADH dehydrogenase (quinone) [Helianthus debilis subsp. tardiflorus]
MHGNLSAWLVKHALIHRSLGFDYQGIETLQIKQGIGFPLLSFYMYMVCIKVFALRKDPRFLFVFWVWKSVDFQEHESYDMFGISYDNLLHLKRILMPESWIGWPLRKDYIAPNFYEILDAH